MVLPDTAITVAVIAAVPAVAGGLAGGWAAIKQLHATNLQMVITSMQTHMATLSADNIDLRSRMRTAEERTAVVERDLVKCEVDKVKMKADNRELRERISNIESSYQVKGNGPNK